LRHAASNCFRHRFQLVEEGLDELVELYPGGRKREWPALEQGDAEELLQLGDLAADGRLLDSIWHVVGSGGNSLVLRHVVEQFQMMNVHGEQQSAAARV
jgi:hypothetical protein